MGQEDGNGEHQEGCKGDEEGAIHRLEAKCVQVPDTKILSASFFFHNTVCEGLSTI
ncbi:MAG: hypothetical protein IK005_02590 [Paludibacteraceae bacterium]|nr:hypothetical protein [Paludibacteraceae bacterium]